MYGKQLHLNALLYCFQYYWSSMILLFLPGYCCSPILCPFTTLALYFLFLLKFKQQLLIFSKKKVCFMPNLFFLVFINYPPLLAIYLFFWFHKWCPEIFLCSQMHVCLKFFHFLNSDHQMRERWKYLPVLPFLIYNSKVSWIAFQSTISGSLILWEILLKRILWLQEPEKG